MNPELRTPSLWRRLDQTGAPMILARAVLGILFIKMGVAKIEDPVHFLKLIRLYQMVPEDPPVLLNLMAVVIPWVEVICGVFLVLGVSLMGTGLLALAMLVIFTGAIFLRAMTIYNAGSIPFTQIEFDCGCGGGPTIIYLKLLENLGLILLTVVILCSGSRKFCLPWTNGWKSSATIPSAPVENGAYESAS